MSGYRGQQLNWQACGANRRCAQVLVPLDYGKPEKQAITLALKQKAATVSPRLGTLFINPGGPGGSGVGYVDQFLTTGLEAYDIVGWDPRGVGQSTPVTCVNGNDLDRYLSMDASPDDQAERQALIDQTRAFASSCLKQSGPLLAHVSTVETVRDLDLLRGLVGDTRINYFGSSYGTRIGALYAQLYPAKVGRLVLDGAVNITDDESVTQLEGFERALGQFAAWCADQKRCRLGDTRAEVLESIRALWQRLDQQPLPAGWRQLTQQLGVSAVIYLLYQDQQAWKVLADALTLAVSDRDGRYLLALADEFNNRGKDGQFGQLNYGFPAVRCLDSQDASVTEADRDLEKAIAKAPIVGPYSGPDLVCPLWPVASAPPAPKITGQGAAPIVVIGTTGDPATPYEYAVGMAKQLDSGVLVTYRGDGHLAYRRSHCVQRLVINYLTLDRLPSDDTTC